METGSPRQPAREEVIMNILRKLSFVAALAGLAAFPALGTAGEVDREGEAEAEVRSELDRGNVFEQEIHRVQLGNEEQPRFEEHEGRIDRDGNLFSPQDEGGVTRVQVLPPTQQLPRPEDNQARIGEDDAKKTFVPEDRGFGRDDDVGPRFEDNPARLDDDAEKLFSPEDRGLEGRRPLE
jgi:hypothetical protein